MNQKRDQRRRFSVSHRPCATVHDAWGDPATVMSPHGRVEATMRQILCSLRLREGDCNARWRFPLRPRVAPRFPLAGFVAAARFSIRNRATVDIKLDGTTRLARRDADDQFCSRSSRTAASSACGRGARVTRGHAGATTLVSASCAAGPRAPLPLNAQPKPKSVRGDGKASLNPADIANQRQSAYLGRLWRGLGTGQQCLRAWPRPAPLRSSSGSQAAATASTGSAEPLAAARRAAAPVAVAVAVARPRSCPGPEAPRWLIAGGT